MKDLKGKNAVITGGGSGIGRGMALAFAEAGMNVVLADIEVDAAASVKAEVEKLGVRGLAVKTDVTQADSVEALADAVYTELGAVHLLCNNAGVVAFGSMHDLTPADWSWVLAVNLHGVVNGIQSFVHRMKKQDGEKHVVNTASTAGMWPHPGLAPYVASKYAVVGISETLRMEGADYGLSCSALCAGNTNTKIVMSARNRLPEFGGPEEADNPAVQSIIDEGMAPEQVGQIVRQGVIDDLEYIWTHPDIRELADARLDAVRNSLDQAQKRNA
ncbi:MAG: SDR family NAD(P)-dependent oxidoreductase [Candidatus Binatia bacterium]|nr:SDR family NAD(P)-dependent oxidoreductase [Candidatus Binatia bacterium]